MFLSVLIPTYNDSCLELVNVLQRQVAEILSTEVVEGAEIVVADDCSTYKNILAEEELLGGFPNCRVIRPKQNLGRAGIRNFLADNAKGDWILFIDGDMAVKNERFLARYLENANADVVYGGYCIDESVEVDEGNLRYKVERVAEAKKTLEARRQHPYNHFHTANFMIRHEVFDKIRFNEDMKLYGFEDVLFGKTLQEDGIQITHIENPVLFGDFESNAEYLRKTEESVRTQKQFEHLIGEYSNLIRAYRKVKRWHLAWIFPIVDKCIGNRLRRNILGNNPSVFRFNLYKLLLFARHSFQNS